MSDPALLLNYWKIQVEYRVHKCILSAYICDDSSGVSKGINCKVHAGWGDGKNVMIFTD